MRVVVASSSPWQRLATVLLEQDLGQWVAERKAHPYKPSWTAIAAELKAATDGQVEVTGETLRLWYGETPTEVAS